jgi:hypothetical protein
LEFGGAGDHDLARGGGFGETLIEMSRKVSWRAVDRRDRDRRRGHVGVVAPNELRLPVGAWRRGGDIVATAERRAA